MKEAIFIEVKMASNDVFAYMLCCSDSSTFPACKEINDGDATYSFLLETTCDSV